MTDFALDHDACRGRQKRLLDEMQKIDADVAIVVDHANVLWLTGVYVSRSFEPAAALRADGHLTLVLPSKQIVEAAADEVLPYEAQWLSTMRNDQRQASSQVLADAILKQGKPRRVAVEYSAYCPYLADAIDAPRVDVEPQLYFLRRRKEADELAKIKMAIAATEAMYDRARQIIRPGVNELEVFNELQSAAVERFGEMLTGTGNDYRCAARGGPPRDRKAQAGELYILDLGPAFRGYYADNCRTISVDGKPTDVQLQAWSHAVKTFEIVEKTVRPGASCKALYEEAKAWMDQSPLGRFDHHLGHGIGIFPHEAPHLNPNWDDTFESGDVFAVEPGIYGDQLAAGIRIEHNYRVTDDGVELLTDFSVEL